MCLCYFVSNLPTVESPAVVASAIQSRFSPGESDLVLNHSLSCSNETTNA